MDPPEAPSSFLDENSDDLTLGSADEMDMLLNTEDMLDMFEWAAFKTEVPTEAKMEEKVEVKIDVEGLEVKQEVAASIVVKKEEV